MNLIWWAVLGLSINFFTDSLVGERIITALIVLGVYVALEQINELHKKNQMLAMKDNYKKPIKKQIDGRWKCPNCKNMITTNENIKNELRAYNHSLIKCRLCGVKNIIGTEK